MNSQTPAMRPVRISDARGQAAGFATLCEELDQLLEELALPGGTACVPQAPVGTGLAPPAELRETPDHYELTVELPGLERGEIMVEFVSGILSVAGEKRDRSQAQPGECLIGERSYGAFLRRFSLLQDVDPERIAASYRHGVLTVTIGKDAAAERCVRAIAVT